MEPKNYQENEDIQAMVSVMDELTAKQLDLKSELKKVEKEIEKVEFLMKEVLEKENQEIIKCGYYSFGWDIKQRTAFDQAKFKEAQPELYEQFKTTKEMKIFRFGFKGE